MFDLRTDTVTLPSPAMRAAMAAAEVGDDFYYEDPTVAALEARAASILSKEAALYVPSGTMGNVLAHLTHCPGGAEVLMPAGSHTLLAEGGAPARIAGMTIRTYHHRAGRLDLEEMKRLLQRRSLLSPGTGLIWVEQPTHGYPTPLSDLADLRALAREHEIPVHCDGARIFNAAIALGTPAATIAELADTVMFCVSKGLAAPVGSLLVGPKGFITEARRHRQMLGGGLRQAGIIAAAGLYALEHNIDRLAEDHANAKLLADGLRDVPGIRLDRAQVETNIFSIELLREHPTPLEFVAALRQAGVLANPPVYGSRNIRLVTHYGIETSHIHEVIRIIRTVLTV